MNNEILNSILMFASLLSAFVMSLVQLVKYTFVIPKNLIPTIGFVIGLLIGAAAYPFTDLTLVERLWAGGIAGLSATGLFELAFNNREGYTRGAKRDRD